MVEPRYRCGDPAPAAVVSRRANERERQFVRYRNRIVGTAPIAQEVEQHSAVADPATNPPLLAEQRDVPSGAQK